MSRPPALRLNSPDLLDSRAHGLLPRPPGPRRGEEVAGGPEAGRGGGPRGREGGGGAPRAGAERGGGGAPPPRGGAREGRPAGRILRLPHPGHEADDGPLGAVGPPVRLPETLGGASGAAAP